ncbi:MAG: ATP synthase subunit C [Gammaproteobacteria bacterium]
MAPRSMMPWLVVAGVSAALATLVMWWSPLMAAQTPEAGFALPPSAGQWGLVAAALATGLSSLGAGLAVASVGSAAIGALAEKPELLGRVLIIVGLAEGIAIYGLIISILILNRIT